MKVAALYIYPFKGGPAVAVDNWGCTPRGFEKDRRFMVCNPAGQFLTQRGNPALGRVQASLTDEGFELVADGIGQLVLSPVVRTERTSVQIWSDSVDAVHVSTAADEFFSTLLGEPAQLVYMPDEVHRPTDEHPDIPLSFADGFPYLIATTASLDDLNARIPGDPVPMAAFRPNIVLDGVTAWEEDRWTTLGIANTDFALATNCERCSVTTLDPQWPDRPRADGEPLRTLAKFRRNARGKVDFARNAVLTSGGTLSVGDVVKRVGRRAQKSRP